MQKEEAFYIGYFTKTKGLKGEIQLYFEFDAYEELDLDVLFAAEVLLDAGFAAVPFVAAVFVAAGLVVFDAVDFVAAVLEAAVVFGFDSISL